MTYTESEVKSMRICYPDRPETRDMALLIRGLGGRWHRRLPWRPDSKEREEYVTRTLRRIVARGVVIGWEWEQCNYACVVWLSRHKILKPAYYGQHQVPELHKYYEQVRDRTYDYVERYCIQNLDRPLEPEPDGTKPTTREVICDLAEKLGGLKRDAAKKALYRYRKDRRDVKVAEAKDQVAEKKLRPTRAAILDMMERSWGKMWTAAEIAEKLALSPRTARRHLQHLVQAGRVYRRYGKYAAVNTPAPSVLWAA